MGALGGWLAGWVAARLPPLLGCCFFWAGLHGSELRPANCLPLLLPLQEADAARAYDRALVRLRGGSAATNFGLGGGAYSVELGDHQHWQALVLQGSER